MKPAKKHYIRNLLLAYTSYALILFGVNTYMNNNDVPLYIAAILALLPMVPVFLVMKAVFVFVATMDELQRRKITEAVLMSFLISAFGLFGYGFLEGVGFPPLPTIWVAPVMIAVFGLSQIIVARRY